MPETHTVLRDRRPITATCPACCAMGTNELKYVVYGEEKNVFIGPTRPAKAEKNLLRWQSKPNKPTKEEPLSFVVSESPFTSVSTVSRGHPSQVSLIFVCNRFLDVSDL